MHDTHTPHSDPGFLPDKGVDTSVIWMMGGALLAILFLLTIVGMARFNDPMQTGQKAARQTQLSGPANPAPAPVSDIGPLAE